MLKKKLLAVVGGSMSVVVAAATAFMLSVSGPRNVLSLHSLSANEAVAQGITNLFSSASSSADTMKEIVDTISTDKAALSVGFNINELQDSPELAGIGGNIVISCDGENNHYSIDLGASYGSVELFNALVYMNDTELRASIPALIDGVLVAPYENLEENLKNSYIGSILEAQGFDYDDYVAKLDEYMAMLNDSAAQLPDVDFDVDKFVDGLSDAMNAAYQDATNNMSVTDNGKQPLAGGSYQSYTAKISVSDLSDIIKEAILFALNDEDFLSYIEELSTYMNDTASDYEDDYSDIMSDYELDLATQLKSVTAMIDSYWGMVVSELEAVFGKNIEFTIYLTDTVETAGFEFYVSPNADGSLNYTKAAATAAEEAFSLKADFTGGAQIGDYTNVTLSSLEHNTPVGGMELTFETEKNGDFNFDFSVTNDNNTIGYIHADGSYTQNGQFFDLSVDSFKLVDEDTTIFDLGFSLAFKEIDGVEKPTASTEYNIWEMTEDDFIGLFEDISEKLDVFGSALN